MFRVLYTHLFAVYTNIKFTIRLFAKKKNLSVRKTLARENTFLFENTTKKFFFFKLFDDSIIKSYTHHMAMYGNVKKNQVWKC